MTQKLLDIRDLFIQLPASAERQYAVQNINLELVQGETLCVVGESGSGKSLTARAVMGLLPEPHVHLSNGEINFNGEDITKVSYDRLRNIRGSEISMIFQEPMTALNPVMSIGSQIDEIFRYHVDMPSAGRVKKAIELLEDVNLPNPAQIMGVYPHELSGGQRQRAMIAMALALKPKILIADEPTTALDVTTQAQILKLIRDMQDANDTGVLFITHDFGVVADIADRVAVMQHGLVVESGTAEQILNNPTHPYTQALIGAVPSLIPRKARAQSTTPVLVTKNVCKTFGGGRSMFGFGAASREVKAVKDVTLNLHKGETLGIVGESGSGKSTLARCIIRLMDTDSGEIYIEGVQINKLSRSDMRPWRNKIQMVFQDPFASLNPRIKVGDIIAQGPVTQGVSKRDADTRARELISIVGLDERAFSRYPHEFSGGQRQRIGIARSLALKPEILIADEPVSALDVSIQAQILDLLEDIRDKMNLSMIFITHDLRVAAQVCDRLAVMQYGEVVEIGATAKIFANPQHPYTRDLLAAVPGKGWNNSNKLKPAVKEKPDRDAIPKVKHVATEAAP
ncbi:MAG: ABC transporter ATP-binding protein [Arenicellales bacterium WSBS_2016_MAG_OTU3]